MTVTVYAQGNYVPRNVKLRWRFDWLNRPTKYGAWSDPGECDSTKAWKQPKDGIVRAAIEAKDLETSKLIVIAECDGHEFIEFRWIACAPLVPRPGIKVVGSIQGMTLVTPSEKIHSYVSGQVVREINREPRVLSHAWKF